MQDLHLWYFQLVLNLKSESQLFKIVVCIMGTMKFGYHYDRGKNVGYDISVEGLCTFDFVAYNSK